jgi:hypothetical protein
MFKSKEDEMSGAYGTHRREFECLRGFGRKIRRKATARWEDNIKMDLKKWDRVVRPGLIYFKIGFNGGLL